MLDISHLELVKGVLKETNFSNKDWYKLGRGLGVHHDKQLLYISPLAENPSNLKECLTRWLSSGTASYRMRIHNDPSTLDDLAAALKSIGYSEAGKYITKTCKLIIMFRPFYTSKKRSFKILCLLFMSSYTAIVGIFT